MGSLNSEIDVLQRHWQDIKNSKGFAYTREDPEVTKEIFPAGRPSIDVDCSLCDLADSLMQDNKYITNCTKCIYTCHFPCPISNDGMSISCIVALFLIFSWCR